MRPTCARSNTSSSRRRCGHLRSRNVTASPSSSRRPTTRYRAHEYPGPARAQLDRVARDADVTIAALALGTLPSRANAGSFAPRRRAVTGAGVAMTTESAGVVVACVSISQG